MNRRIWSYNEPIFILDDVSCKPTLSHPKCLWTSSLTRGVTTTSTSLTLSPVLMSELLLTARNLFSFRIVLSLHCRVWSL